MAGRTRTVGPQAAGTCESSGGGLLLILVVCSQLLVAFAVAVTLNRTLVMPKLVCFCDRYWCAARACPCCHACVALRLVSCMSRPRVCQLERRLSGDCMHACVHAGSHGRSPPLTSTPKPVTSSAWIVFPQQGAAGALPGTGRRPHAAALCVPAGPRAAGRAPGRRRGQVWQAHPVPRALLPGQPRHARALQGMAPPFVILGKPCRMLCMHASASCASCQEPRHEYPQ